METLYKLFVRSWFDIAFSCRVGTLFVPTRNNSANSVGTKYVPTLHSQSTLTPLGLPVDSACARRTNRKNSPR